MTSDDIKSVQIIATTKDGKRIMAVSDERPLGSMCDGEFYVESKEK